MQGGFTVRRENANLLLLVREAINIYNIPTYDTSFGT